VQRGTLVQVNALRGVVLCAGAVKSPQLLMLSGIGPRAALSALGIRVHVDLPGVGQGLMDHPMVKLSARVHASTYNVETGPLGALRHLWRYIRHRDGLLASPHAQLLAHLLRSGPMCRSLFIPTPSSAGRAVRDVRARQR
jgi:choline dehydrogenase